MAAILSDSIWFLRHHRPRPASAVPELLSYEISLPAIGCLLVASGKLFFFSVFSTFYFSLLCLWQLAIYASLMPPSREESGLSLLASFSFSSSSPPSLLSLCSAPFEQLFDYFHSICSFWVAAFNKWPPLGPATIPVALVIFKKYKTVKRAKKKKK